MNEGGNEGEGLKGRRRGGSVVGREGGVDGGRGGREEGTREGGWDGGRE